MSPNHLRLQAATCTCIFNKRPFLHCPRSRWLLHNTSEMHVRAVPSFKMIIAQRKQRKRHKRQAHPPRKFFFPIGACLSQLASLICVTLKKKIVKHSSDPSSSLVVQRLGWECVIVGRRRELWSDLYIATKSFKNTLSRLLYT